ncbi:MAG: glycoside hydrolase N-terminal domain-containing protein [Planctomycetota bacterium]
MIKRRLFVSALLLLAIASWASAASENPQAEKSLSALGITSMHRSVVSDVSARTWEKAMVTGNGVQGAMAMGRAPEETIVLNHAGLFLPLAVPFPTVSQAKIIPELRQMIEKGKFQAASDRVFAYGKSEGKNGDTWTDPFVPACSLKVAMPNRGAPKNYLRSTDFMTGVTGTYWEDDAGVHARRLFVSRPDNVVVLSLTGSKGVDCDLGFVLHDPKVGNAAPPKRGAIREARAEAQPATEGGSLTFRAVYARHWPGSLQGCEVAARVIVKGGTTTAGTMLTVRGASEVLVVLRTTLSRDIEHSQIPQELVALGKLDGSYDTLLARHATVHGAIMDRCHLDLGGSEADHRLTAPSLFAKSKVGSLNAALLEKEFDASRYLVLSSSGPEYPPTLQGIWGATWTPDWSGDYTQNGNLQTVMASALSANIPEALEGFFHYLEVQLPDYRDNARRLFGTRGIHIPHRTSTHGLNNRWIPSYPMTFWTAGAAWNAEFFYDYWQVTGDKEFLLKHALPWMKESAAFYEDFLYPGADGKWMFSPSYSPENEPANSHSQSALNATMDLAAAKELFGNLVTVCEKLGIESENLPKWKGILAKMPAYPVNADGAVAEWNTPLLKDNYAHRHASHLYGLYAGLPAEVAADSHLQAAFKVAIEKRMKWRRANGGADMAFGLCQLGWAAASLHDGNSAYETLDWLANKFWFAESMVTSHNVRSIFNVDLGGGLPQIVLAMLVQSEPRRIELLPAMPKAWQSGSVTGVLCRGQVEIRRLQWRGGSVTVTLRSAIDQLVTLQIDGLQEMAVAAGPAKIVGENAGNTRNVNLVAGSEVTLEIKRSPLKEIK